MGLLERLAEKNQNLDQGPPVTIAFLGDSVTQGCFELVKDRSGKIDTVFEQDSAYHHLFKQLLTTLYPSVPITVINAGISGNSARQGYERLRRDVLNYSPDLVVVCFGLNDCMTKEAGIADYQTSLTRIFNELQAAAIPVIFMTPNQMNTYIHPSIIDTDFREMARQTAEVQNTGILDSYMQAAKEVCSQESVHVCDCYEKWKILTGNGVDTTALLANFINHPTREMHAFFANELFRSVMFKEN